MIYRPELKAAVIRILKTCVGKENAISANQLFTLVTGEAIVPSMARNQTRIIRSIVQDIRYAKELPIISGNGYWLAESDQELEEYTVRLLREAENKFGLARTLSRVPVSRMVQQHNFNFSDEELTHD